MAMRESAVHKNHNPTLYITELSPTYQFFIIVAYPGHILESTKGIEIKLGTYIDVNLVYLGLLFTIVIYALK